ncbi:MAG: ubiquinol oxidase subunit II [Chlamydiae bacterium]|nr:MAG: ubiquinol oxidase subunit II [Chlamydiota bacterium]
MKKKCKALFFILLSLSVVVLSLVYLSNADIAVLNPKGMIALKERNLFIKITLIMLIVVIPVFILTWVISWKYKEGNKAKYTPDWDQHLLSESIWWGFPCAIVLAMSILVWKSTHELDPFKPIESIKRPLRIQVVALQWKWLFIYPEQGIATVNFLQFPEQTPINFEITADAPMNSFWIPELGGQIYAMPGMKSKLHLIANEKGSFRGSSANLSGRGFAGMTFVAKASSQTDFYQWIESINQSSNSLNLAEYTRLAEPSEDDPEIFYVLENQDLYDWIIHKYTMPMTRMN